MDVSIVIPTRDRPELLALTVRSALQQKDVKTEVLVVDDGTDAATARVIERFGDPRIRIMTNTGPRGVSGARNSGVAAARGDWIAFLDDDDLWAPDKLAAQLGAAGDAGAGWVYAGHVLVDEGLRVRGGDAPLPPERVVNELRRYNAVPAGASNVAVRRDVLGGVGRFDTELQTSEDWDLWLRLAAIRTPAWVPRPLVALRSHAAMASRAVDRILADIEVIAHRHGIPVDRARHHRWAAWMCLEERHRGQALRHYASAVMAGDVMSLGRAAVALVNPQVARSRPPRPDDEWARDAQVWLDVLRDEAQGADHIGRPLVR